MGGEWNNHSSLSVVFVSSENERERSELGTISFVEFVLKLHQVETQCVKERALCLYHQQQSHNMKTMIPTIRINTLLYSKREGGPSHSLIEDWRYLRVCKTESPYTQVRRGVGNSSKQKILWCEKTDAQRCRWIQTPVPMWSSACRYMNTLIRLLKRCIRLTLLLLDSFMLFLQDELLWKQHTRNRDNSQKEKHKVDWMLMWSVTEGRWRKRGDVPASW